MVQITSDQKREIIYFKKKQRLFHKGDHLGSGSVSECYKVVEESTGNVYACKIIPIEELDSAIAELDLLPKLEHANILKFEDADRDDQNIYLLLELCGSRTLLDLVEDGTKLSEDEVRRYFRQILLGCQYLHENKIIHHDLKLNNVFLCADLTIRIGDFGLATEGKKSICEMIGTPNYLAPEMLKNQPHSEKVDIWALGCMLYYMVVGEAPFTADTVEDVYARIKKHDLRIPKEVSQDAKDVIRAMIQSQPTKRPKIDKILLMPFFASESNIADQTTDVPGEALSDARSDVYEVYEILDKRKKGRTVEYLIRWLGYTAEHNTWKPASGCDCAQKIKEFELKQKSNVPTVAAPRNGKRKQVKKANRSSPKRRRWLIPDN